MTSRLVFYRPRTVLKREYAQLPGMEIFRTYLRLYSIVSPIDSTNTIQTPFNMQNLFPLPDIQQQVESYENLCDARAKRLLDRAEALDVPMYVSYSGGIDSTLVLISLLKNATPSQKKRITVLLTEESITENPNFYRDHIRGHLTTLPGTRLPLLYGNRAIITSGELNDQLFGSDIVASFINMKGAAAMHATYSSEAIVDLFDATIGSRNISRSLVSILEKTFSGAPRRTPSSNYEALWWFNFNMKWQSVYFRALSSVHPSRVHLINKEYLDTFFAPFFCTDEFRLWSMQNPDKKIRDTWRSYKWLPKEIIFKYNKDAEYRDHKTKRGSLAYLLRQHDLHNIIDADIHFLQTLNIEKHYQAENDFVTPVTE